MTDPSWSVLGNYTWNGGFSNGLRHGEGVLWRPQREQDPYTGGFKRFVGNYYEDNINHGKYTEYSDFNGIRQILNWVAVDGNRKAIENVTDRPEDAWYPDIDPNNPSELPFTPTKYVLNESGRCTVCPENIPHYPL